MVAALFPRMEKTSQFAGYWQFLGSFAERTTTNVTTGLIRTIGIAALLCLVAVQASGTEDDGWRRTKFGWQNIKQWNLPAEMHELPGLSPRVGAIATLPAITSPAAEKLSVLLHPAVIALGLMLVAFGALRTFVVAANEATCQS